MPETFPDSELFEFGKFLGVGSDIGKSCVAVRTSQLKSFPRPPGETCTNDIPKFGWGESPTPWLRRNGSAYIRSTSLSKVAIPLVGS